MATPILNLEESMNLSECQYDQSELKISSQLEVTGLQSNLVFIFQVLHPLSFSIQLALSNTLSCS